MKANKFSLCFIIASALFPQLVLAQTQNVRNIAAGSDNPPYAAVRPYWVDRPIIEIIGRAEKKVMPNRAEFSIVYKEVASDSDEATAKLTERVRPGIDKVRAMIGNKGGVNATYDREILYQQYRDKDGNRIDNEREDKIDKYVAIWRIKIELSDLNLIAPVRAELIAIGNAEIRDGIEYSLEPTPSMAREIRTMAMNDGLEMAKTVANAHGKTLKLLVYEEGRTQCLSSPTTQNGSVTDRSGAPAYSSTETVMVTGSRRPKLTPEQLILPVSPQLVTLTSSVCLVYAID